MRCDRFREAASARLDGEPIGMSAAALDGHLASCPECAGWLAEATRLTRMSRLGSVDVPDLSDAITANIALPAGRVRRRRQLLRLALLVVGVAQLIIAIPALGGTSIGMAMSAHATHEAAAWNLALAAAFLAAAAAPRRAAGLIPILGTFIVTLTIFSIHDIAAGVVTADRLATHIAGLVGLLLLLILDRVERALPPGWHKLAERGRRERDRPDSDQQRGLRGVA